MNTFRAFLLITPLLALAAACTAAGGPGASPDGAPEVQFTASVETVYYSVHGRTTPEIFGSLEAEGPRLEGVEDGKFASGLTANESSFGWEFLEGDAYCDLRSVDIRVDLVVTLPEHADPDALSPEQSARWQAFAEEVATHEQRHVDIHLERMETFKATVQGLPTRFTDCASLQSRLETAWDEERGRDERQQEAFHRTEEVATRQLTQPLRDRIDANQAELARLELLRSGLSSEIQGLQATITVMDAQGEDVLEQIHSLRRSHPGNRFPPDEYERYQELVDQWNALNHQRNTLVEQANRLVSLHTQAVTESNDLIGGTNLLLEELAWLS